MSESLFNILETRLKSQPERVAYRIKRGLRQTVWTNSEVLRDVMRLRIFFKNEKLKVGDRVMIWAPNMPEWAITFLACLGSGIVLVPVDVRSNWQTVENYIKEIKPKCLVCSKLTASELEPDAVKIYFLEDIFVNLPDSKTKLKTTPHPNKIVEILFTSGTSNNPKGVVIKEQNIIAQLKQSEILIPPLSRYETISILPLSHIYEQMYDFFLPIYRFGTVNYLVRINPLSIKKSLRRYKATYLMVVPEFLRLLWDDILINAEKIDKKNQFEKMVSIAKYFPKSLQRIIFRQVHKSFGGELSLVTCGGAPLEKKLANAFEALGFTVIEGYGSTETVGIVTCMNWTDRVFGTVGKPTEKVKVKIGDENEILVKGKVVFDGYYQQSEATKKSFTTGWYKTGDTGKFDRLGNLIITGRVSSRIVLDDGTKVYPEDIERTLNNDSKIKDSCVVAKQTPEGVLVHAFVIGRDKSINKEIDKVIARVNKILESKQQIQSFAVWPADKFPRTRTLKIDRKQVAKELIIANSKDVEDHKNLSLENFENIVKRISKRDSIKDKDKLGDDLGLDSLRRIQLIAALEEHLGIIIDDVSLTAQTTVKDLKDAIKQNVIDKSLLVDKVLDSLALKAFACKIRAIFQTVFVFPIYRYWVRPRVVLGESILNQAPHQALYIFNHIGMFDVVGVLSVLPPRHIQKLAIPVTNERWNDGNMLVQNLIEKALGGFPFAREGKEVTAGMEIIGGLVDKGFSVILAPEGAMEREGKILKFKPGLGYLVRELGLPVIMVKIDEVYREIFPPPPPHLSATDRGYFYPKKRGVVDIKVATAKINSNLTNDELTVDLQRQFESL